MKIRLTALGEVSLLTGGKLKERGDVVDVSKAKAAEAIKGGRWEPAFEGIPSADGESGEGT